MSSIDDVITAATPNELPITAGGRAYVVRALGAPAWRALAAEHPPTPEARTAGLDYDPATFVPAAIAACTILPALTAGDVVDLAATHGLDAVALLFEAARQVNRGVPRSAASSVTFIGAPA